MARSDLLRKLFASYARSDDAGFRAVARELVADERRKRHDHLAADLSGRWRRIYVRARQFR